MAYEVNILETAKDFLDNLEPKLRAKSYRTIQMLTQFGPVLTLPHSRKIVGSEDLYELRVQQGNNICRLFYFYYNKAIYIILSGFIKKQQKMDPKEIEKALEIRRKYVEDKINENNIEKEIDEINKPDEKEGYNEGI
ncbi:MAG: type II toxin-antitoxin system RelE/ParE family toxin [Treponema sp.]|jgi:phage-related protein|nr:type II toxin-antitoxin system RelE/ParE family toxin [Treponema sp.]